MNVHIDRHARTSTHTHRDSPVSNVASSLPPVRVSDSLIKGDLPGYVDVKEMHLAVLGHHLTKTVKSSGRVVHLVTGSLWDGPTNQIHPTLLGNSCYGLCCLPGHWLSIRRKVLCSIRTVKALLLRGGTEREMTQWLIFCLKLSVCLRIRQTCKKLHWYKSIYCTAVLRQTNNYISFTMSMMQRMG